MGIIGKSQFIAFGILLIFFLTGFAIAEPVIIEEAGCINVSLTADQTTFSVANGGFSDNFTATPATPYRLVADNYTWKIQNQQTNVWVYDNTTQAPQNYDNYTFVTPGTYLVRLFASNSTDSGCEQTKDLVVTATKPISGNFTWGPTGNNYEVNYTYFLDSGSPVPSDFVWKYGDNSPNLTTTSYTTFKTFPAAGNYTSTVTARNTTASYIVENSTQQIVTVQAPPVSDFWIVDNYTQAPIPFTAAFDNNSTNATAYSWNFGDGNTSTDSDPTHLYSKPGIFTIILNATSDWGWNLSQKTLIAYENISANYTYTTEPCPVFPVDVTFRDNSTGGTISNWTWFFDDGSLPVNVTTNTITHQFHSPRVYNITMRAYNMTFGVFNQTSQNVDITGLYANFTANPWERFISRGETTTVTFNSTSVGTNSLTQYRWDFANGDYDITPNTSTEYVRNGTYNVTLTLTNITCGESNSTTKSVRIIENLTADFEWAPTFGTFPLNVTFVDTSEDTPNQWMWKIFYPNGTQYLPTIIDNPRPSRIFPEPGTYRVELSTANALGHWAGPKSKNVTLTTGITADFTANRTAGVAPLAVQFTDNSSPLSEISNRTWNFGDGEVNSTETNPIHIFSQAGNYTVTLTAWNASSGSSGVKQKASYISVGSPLVANFVPNSSFKVNSSLLVNFTDLSTPVNQITNWSWSFGDNQSSTLQNPVHQFPSFGIYNVSLNVSNPFYGSSNITTFPVNISEIKIPVAKFEGNPRTVTTNQTVSFTDKSEGPEINKWSWDFGDGTTSNETNPSHGYVFAGFYNISLTATNPYGSGSTTVENYIKVKGPVIADFVTDPSDWGVVNQPVMFIDASKGQPISWTWNFGDSNSTTTASPTIAHTYASAGWYTINMTGTNWDGQSGSAVKQIEITDKTRPRDVNFGVVGKKYSGPHPLTVQFEDFTPNQSNVTEWYWDFGDRTNAFTTTPAAPSHTYAIPGEYTVTLTVRNEVGVNEKIRVAYVVVI